MHCRREGGHSSSAGGNMSLSMLFMLMSAAVSQSSVYATSNILGPRQVACMQNVHLCSPPCTWGAPKRCNLHSLWMLACRHAGSYPAAQGRALGSSQNPVLSPFRFNSTRPCSLQGNATDYCQLQSQLGTNSSSTAYNGLYMLLGGKHRQYRT